jgi:osmoprotectant transport system substrate-binding protein
MFYGLAATALCLAMALPAAAADSSSSNWSPDSGKPLAKTVDLSGAHLSVGSKEFTEQKILGKITVLLLEAAGADVDDKTGIAGSNAVRRALTTGNIDMYWEYTGTAWVNYLGHSSTKMSEGALYKKTAKQDLKKNHIKWLTPANFNNSYGMAVNHQLAEKYNLKTIQDLGRLIKNHPDDATLCTGAEFATRPDGLKGMEKTYGFQFPPQNIIRIDFALVYKMAAKGSQCKIANVYTTDGRIPALHLVLLKDNENFFPPYHPALNVRESVYKKYPQLSKLFDPVADALHQHTMQNLNKEVDVEGKFPKPVAKQFLVKHHFIAK